WQRQCARDHPRAVSLSHYRVSEGSRAAAPLANPFLACTDHEWSRCVCVIARLAKIGVRWLPIPVPRTICQRSPNGRAVCCSCKKTHSHEAARHCDVPAWSPNRSTLMNRISFARFSTHTRTLSLLVRLVALLSILLGFLLPVFAPAANAQAAS